MGNDLRGIPDERKEKTRFVTFVDQRYVTFSRNKSFIFLSRIIQKKILILINRTMSRFVTNTTFRENVTFFRHDFVTFVLFFRGDP